jgi:two-component system CheB/CheR fusion protein
MSALARSLARWGPSMATIADDAHPRDKRCGVVGIGASAGGLDAFGRLLDALPVNTGMAFVLIQHLDPSHESMLGHLLSIRTKMPVMEAVAAMKVEPDHVYICPPGSYLSMDAGAFRLTSPKASLRVRLPIDFFFQSLAVECGADAMAVILSGYGEDGSIGIAAVAARGGFIIVQEPKDAESDAMPCSAMATGLADVVLPVADIANVIRARGAHGAGPVGDKLAAATGDLKAIIDLLGRETAHEFSNYKTGTLQRQIERRMATSGASDAAAYLARLHNDRDELETLATDMFINVTGFFRDPDSFRLVGDEILADLKRDKSMAKDFRIWSAGCSTGEEAYSLAILRLEAMASSGARGRLQVFASDIDAAAVQKARAGLYPASIAEDVSPERLERFFFKEDGGFRVSPELRGAVVFAVHDLLADPPFLHMDLIACRNLIIYLKGDAQRAVLQQLDFALNDGGILLLGGSETVGMMKDRFKTIDGKQRLYRHEGAIRGGALARTGPALKRAGDPSILEARGRPSMRTDLGESARAFILATLAPAAVVINDRRQLLYASGSTDRFLRLPEGEQDADILAMARGALRGGMRTAITLAIAERRLVTNTVALTAQGRTMTVEVSVQPMLHDGVYFYLLSFVEENERAAAEFAVSDSATGTLDQDVGQAELEANRRELDAALRDIDVLESDVGGRGVPGHQ